MADHWRGFRTFGWGACRVVELNDIRSVADGLSQLLLDFAAEAAESFKRADGKRADSYGVAEPLS